MRPHQLRRNEQVSNKYNQVTGAGLQSITGGENRASLTLCDSGGGNPREAPRGRRISRFLKGHRFLEETRAFAKTWSDRSWGHSRQLKYRVCAEKVATDTLGWC